MKRDMEMIRQILCEVAETNSEHGIVGYDDSYTAYQVALLKDAGLIDAVLVEDGLGFPARASILRRTWAGHEFLDSSRDSKVWKKAIEHVIKPGLSWSFPIPAEWLKQEAQRRLFGVSSVGSDSTPVDTV